MKKILLELNGGRETPADFWVSFSNIFIVIVPLIFSLSVYPGKDDNEIFFFITKQVKWGLVGLVLALLAIAITIITFIPKPTTDSISPSNRSQD